MPVLITELEDGPLRPVVNRSDSFTTKVWDDDESKILGGLGKPLPRSVHMPFILEALLREAPFATGKAHSVWRCILRSTAFQDLSWRCEKIRYRYPTKNFL